MTRSAAAQHYREVGAGMRANGKSRCDDLVVLSIAQDKVYRMLRRGILSGDATRPAPHQYVVTQAIYDGIVDLGAEPVLPHINLVITVREIPCGHNGGRPCDYTGREGKGYCEGCCRCPQ
jgi:hypothetical protein